eukprot:scaffold163745_cov20-Tisochrysis_lutea.AAC.4
MVEAWLPPYGPRLHILHRPGSWMLVQPPPQLDLDSSGGGQGRSCDCVAWSGNAQGRGVDQGGVQGVAQKESHMKAKEVSWGKQGAGLARKRQEEGCFDAHGCSQRCSRAGAFQGQGEMREEESAQGEEWPCNARGEEESAGWRVQHVPALMSVAGVDRDRSLALSGCWLLDPSTGTLTSLAALLALELAASVLRLKAGPF